MKRAFMSSVIGLLLGFICFAFDSNDAYAARQISHTAADYRVIPDKYNTGADEELLTPASVNEAVRLKNKYNGLPFKKSSDTVLTINFHANTGLSGEIVIENVDFRQSLNIYNSALCKGKLNIVFKNCKFPSFGMNDENDLIHYEFRNCTFGSISGSNMDLYNCHITGGQSDGIRAMNNVNVIDCYISDKSQAGSTSSVGNHTDGTQIYGNKNGVCKNIHYENCRFELPTEVGSTAAMNACIMLQIEYSDADDISFKDCYINGGGYSIYAWSKKSQYSLTNAVVENISVGCANLFGNVYPRVGTDVSLKNIHNTGSLYVASVWTTDDNKTHISVTNDTNEVRTLCVFTNKGEAKYEIPACPKNKEMVKGVTFQDLPFDIDIEVGDINWVVCYDVTDGNYNQIRYVNYSERRVFFHEEAANTSDLSMSRVSELSTLSVARTATVQKSSVVAEGKCGVNVSWTLTSDGTLALTGSGATYDYHSANKAPWTKYLSKIKKITVSEGITKLGNQLFRDCVSLESAELPLTLKSIGKIVFQKCTKLRTIEIPANVTFIGDRCFSGVTLDSASYLGTKWSTVSVGTYNSSFISALNK